MTYDNARDLVIRLVERNFELADRVALLEERISLLCKALDEAEKKCKKCEGETNA